MINRWFDKLRRPAQARQTRYDAPTTVLNSPQGPDASAGGQAQVDKTSIDTAYQAVLGRWSRANDTLWTGFYNYLVANSLLLLAWAAVFVGSVDWIAKVFVLTPLSAAGLALSVYWRNLGRNHSIDTFLWYETVMSAGKHLPKGAPNPCLAQVEFTIRKDGQLGTVSSNKTLAEIGIKLRGPEAKEKTDPDKAFRRFASANAHDLVMVVPGIFAVVYALLILAPLFLSGHPNIQLPSLPPTNQVVSTPTVVLEPTAAGSAAVENGATPSGTAEPAMVDSTATPVVTSGQ
jgi:hypothetical protein